MEPKIIKEWDGFDNKKCQERQIECGCIESNVYTKQGFILLTACDEHNPWTEKLLNENIETWERNFLLRVRPWTGAKDDALPNVVDVQVYECYITDKGLQNFQKKGSPSSPDYEPDLQKAEMYLEGSIRFDGCSNLRFLREGYLHFCGKADAIRIGDIMKQLYTMAAEMMQRDLS